MIKNLEEALAPLLALQKGAKEAKNRAELIVAERIMESAKITAPGSLGSKISVSQTDEETMIDAGDELSAFIEFGTGQNAATFLAGKPEEQVAEAKKFFVNGKGTLNAQAFFFPAVYEHIEELPAEIEKELTNLIA